MPSPPAANKWGKLANAVDTMTFGYAVHGVWPKAFARLQLDTSAAVDADMDSVLQNDLSFSAVAGVRYKTSNDFLNRPCTEHKLTILGLVLEPMSALTAWLMRRARDTEDSPCRCPLMDLVHPPASIVVSVLQYLSSMLDGSPTRLMMLWRPSGCTSLQEWIESRPQQVRLLRRLTLLVSSALYRRFVHTVIDRFPFKLVCLADSRVSREKQRDISIEFFGKTSCCLEAGFAQKLRGPFGLNSGANVSKQPVNTVKSQKVWSGLDIGVCGLFDVRWRLWWWRWWWWRTLLRRYWCVGVGVADRCVMVSGVCV